MAQHDPDVDKEDDDALELGSHKPGDSIFEAYRPAPDVWGPGPDGLLSPVETDTSDGPYPLTPENLICMQQPGSVPRCSYYKRQLVPLGEHHDQRAIERWCTHPAMRGLNGAALSLSDSAMFACELRDPPHPASDALLDEADNQLVRRASTKKWWRLFRTPEEAAAGITELAEHEFTTKPVP